MRFLNGGAWVGLGPHLRPATGEHPERIPGESLIFMKKAQEFSQTP
jgi:hypothetical protein